DDAGLRPRVCVTHCDGPADARTCAGDRRDVSLQEPAHALQSSLAPERATTSAHLAESLRITSENSSGVPPAGSSPIWAKRSRKVGDSMARLIAALSLSRIGRGMPAGAITPLQVAAS